MTLRNRRLLLLRHAKSSWTSHFESDFDRPLANRGKRDAPKVGAWLKHQGLLPDIVLSSPAKRANETVLKVCQELSFEKEKVRWIQDIYEATWINLIAILKTCPETAKMVLMVGHNPGLETLLEVLSKDRIILPKDGKLLTTACLADLEFETPWSDLEESVARINSITRPREM